MSQLTCSYEDCTRQHYGKSYCRAHWEQLHTRGYLGPIRGGTPQERFWQKVDKTGSCWTWTGGKFRQGYGSFKVDGKVWKAHRLSWTWHRGDIPEGFVIDHMCHNKACVNPSHLRLATNQENVEYRKGAAKHNKAGVRGVHWNKDCRKWRGTVVHKGTKYDLGMFTDLDAAESAVKAKRAELFTFPEFQG